MHGAGSVSRRLGPAACVGAGAQQIGDEAGQLYALFSSVPNRLCSCTRLRVNLYLRASRPPDPLLGVGHKAQDELLSHEALHQPFASGKSLFRHPPRLTAACARWSVPQIGLAPRASGASAPVQLSASRPDANTARVPLTTRRLALDEQSASARESGGLVRPSAVQSGSHFDLDVGHTTPTSLVHVDSCDSGTTSASPGERRACLVASVRSRLSSAYSGATTPNYSINHARSDHTVARLDGSMV